MKRQFLSFALLSTISVFNIASAQLIDPENIIDVASYDWNKDGLMDRAYLVRANSSSDDNAGLYIYLSDRMKTQQKLVASRPNLAWAGLMAGTIPELKITESGSLQLHSGNESIGRGRWTKTLTIAHRQFTNEKSFIVAGYTYTSRDTLVKNSETRCDINLLTGKGFNNKDGFKLNPSQLTLAEWSEDLIPDTCKGQ